MQCSDNVISIQRERVLKPEYYRLPATVYSCIYYSTIAKNNILDMVFVYFYYFIF